MFHIQRACSNVKNTSRAGESLNKNASGILCTAPPFVLSKGFKGHSGFLPFLSWVYSTDTLRSILFKASCKVDTPKSTPTNPEQRLFSCQKIFQPITRRDVSEEGTNTGRLQSHSPFSHHCDQLLGHRVGGALHHSEEGMAAES